MFKKIVPIMAIIAVLFIIIICTVYFKSFPGGFSDKSSDWGAFGSYVGGTVGGVFASLSFLILLYTAYLQREELTTAINALSESADSQKQQVKKSEAQKFETTFYSLLELHNQTLRELDLNDAVSCLKTTHAKSSIWALKGIQNEILSNVELSRYFRVLYQLLKFVAKNHIKNKEKIFNSANLGHRDTIKLYEDVEKMYASIIRSFVPVQLLPVLALNCIPSQEGLENLDKFWSLLERYEFLGHLNVTSLKSSKASTFFIFDRYSYAMGYKTPESKAFITKAMGIKHNAPHFFIDGLMEGGYLHTLSEAGALDVVE